jgi:hypothetical protein
VAGVSTPLGIGLVIGLALAVEGWALLNSRPGDTISEVTWRTLRRNPFISFLLGYLMGHLTWPPADFLEGLK